MVNRVYAAFVDALEALVVPAMLFAFAKLLQWFF
jgi:hypothetical protein